MKKIVLSLVVLIVSLSMFLPGVVKADAGVPDAPNDLTLTAGSDFVNLAWKAPASVGGNLTNYSVYKGSSADGIHFLNNVTANVTAYHDSHVVIGETYFYYITAWNEENESAMCNTVVVTIVSQVERNQDMLPVFSIVIAVIALQLGVVAIWVIVRKAGGGK